MRCLYHLLHHHLDTFCLTEHHCLRERGTPLKIQRISWDVCFLLGTDRFGDIRSWANGLQRYRPGVVNRLSELEVQPEVVDGGVTNLKELEEVGVSWTYCTSKKY